ncbi:MAG: Hsp70 family protein [Phycisphaerales bacterium]|nr:Hsp70 family protein [Phycisphaerales bacterium]
MAEAEPIVGIDLGTTNSLVAVCDEAGPRVIASPNGERMLPSVVRFGSDGRVEAIGAAARREAETHPYNTIASIKRLMGRGVDDARDDAAFLGYEIVEGPNKTARVRIGEQLVSPQEVSAAILRELKHWAETALGHAVRDAVITVPAYFDDAQRQATRDAARLAGLEAKRIVNEPTAAALAYGIGVGEARKAQTIAVYDLGGGTFDISILKLIPASEGTADDAAHFFQVLATAGDTHLGGDDVDAAIVRLLLDETEVAPTATGRQQLRVLAERAKVALSDAEQATIVGEIEQETGVHRVERVLTRKELDALALPLVERSELCCKRAMRDAKVTPEQIDRVVLVGGATRMPLVRQRVGALFQATPYTALNPDEVVALGAAVQGAVLSGQGDALLLDVLPLSLGMETVGGAVAKLILRNSTVPARATEMFSTSVDGQTAIKINVVQGEREMVEDCRSLGEFTLRGIPPMPAGIPQLEVEFLVDANGVLNVSAIERRSGARVAAQIVPNHGLSREEVERMEREALAHARDDMTRHRVVDLIANSKLDLKWIGDRLRKLGAEVDPSYRAELERLCGALDAQVEAASRDWRSIDADAFHKTKEALDKASVRLHEQSIVRTLREDD